MEKFVDEIAMKPLTDRELTCLRWAAIGKTSWEVGVILGLAERTINFHIHNACRKLDVHGRQAAITHRFTSGFASASLPSHHHRAQKIVSLLLRESGRIGRHNCLDQCMRRHPNPSLQGNRRAWKRRRQS